jgi:hypothetical protein
MPGNEEENRSPITLMKEPGRDESRHLFLSGPVKETPSRAFEQDMWFYRIIALCLSLVALFSVVGFIVLAAFDKPMPEGLIALGSGAIGALAGVLASAPNRR